MPSRLPQVRQQLLVLHRTLLEAQRADYERAHGRVTSGAFLELVVNAPEFAWLRPMTALIVSLDEALEAPVPDALAAAEIEAAYAGDVRKLVSANAEGSEAERRYAAALQSAPDVVMAHGALMRVLPGAAAR